MMALSYFCMAIAFARRHAIATPQLWLLLRAAWCTAAVCWLMADVQTAFACGAVLVASFLLSPRFGFLVMPALWLVTPIAPAAFLLGWLCAWSAISGKAEPIKLLGYWSSFILMFAVLLPRAIALDASPTTPRIVASAVLACLGLALAAAGTRAFSQSGGTPEPLDPPPTLCTNGIYAFIRHPLQLAEIGFAAAGALYFGQPAHAAYWVVFTLSLVGPMRVIEERHLRRAFANAEAYIATTPAYFPRLGAKRHVHDAAAKRHIHKVA